MEKICMPCKQEYKCEHAVRKYNCIIQIMNTKKEEWEYRLNCLKEQINYWITNKNEKTVEIIELFY